MIVTTTSAAAAIRFTPDHLLGQEGAPVFLLRAGNVLERELMEADLAGEYQAGEVWPWDLHSAILDGLQQLGGSSAEELIAIAEAVYGGENPAPVQAATYAEALAELAKYWPPYRLQLAQQKRRNMMGPLVAFRRFCCGWENLPQPFKRDPRHLVEVELLDQIDPYVLRIVGLETWKLQWGQSAEKNSASPSKSDDAPATSNSAAPSKAADGKSTRKSTRKIRA